MQQVKFALLKMSEPQGFQGNRLKFTPFQNHRSFEQTTFEKTLKKNCEPIHR